MKVSATGIAVNKSRTIFATFEAADCLLNSDQFYNWGYEIAGDDVRNYFPNDMDAAKESFLESLGGWHLLKRKAVESLIGEISFIKEVIRIREKDAYGKELFLSDYTSDGELYIQYLTTEVEKITKIQSDKGVIALDIYHHHYQESMLTETAIDHFNISDAELNAAILKILTI